MIFSISVLKRTLGGSGLGFLLAALGLASTIASGGSNSDGSPSAVPQFNKVVVVVEENASFTEVIGTNAMPYLNGLASKYSLATNYFANTHPSIGNYFMMTTGTIVTNDDTFTNTVSVDNLARQFAKDGKTWKVYAESIPSPGYLGGNQGLYLKRHNPFSYFSDVANDRTQAANIVPFSKFSSDVATGLPNFSLVIPNVRNDAHDCPNGGSSCTEEEKLATADRWLKKNIDPLIRSGAMGNTLLIITFDEANPADIDHGGGRIATVIVSPKANQGFQGRGTYQHQNLLRTLAEALRLSAIPGAGSNAASMREFFP
jgi:acid phosphatase